MDWMGTLVSFAALAVLAAFLAGFTRLPAGGAPFTAVCLTMVWCSVFGCLGLMAAGGWLYFALCAAAAAVLTVKKRWGRCLDPAFLLFCAASLALLALFAFKKPLYTTWDEFSFWGTAIKLCHLNDELYTTAEIGWPWVASQKPGLIVLSWLFNFVGPYAEWRAYFAIDLAAIAVMALIIALGGREHLYAGIAGAGAAFFVPFLVTIYRSLETPSIVYTTALGDMPMGWLFGGAVLLFFLLHLQSLPLWPVLPALAALTLVRDTAFPLALIAAGLMAVDLLWVGREFRFGPLQGKGAKWAGIGCAFAVPTVTFVAWAFYLQSATGADAFGDIGGTEQMSMFGMLQSGLLQLFGIGTTAKFTDTMRMMWQYYASLRMTLLGSGLQVTALVAVLVALSAVLAADGAQRRRVLLFGAFSAAGFWAFHTFTGFTYVFIFKAHELENGLSGYERYIYPYYFAWLLIAIGLLAHSAGAGCGRRRFAAGLAMFVLLAAFGGQTYRHVAPDMTFIGYHDGYLHMRRRLQTVAENTQKLLHGEPEAPVFYISQGDNGNGWFTCAYELLPVQLDYSFGGGTFGTQENVDPDNLYARVLEMDELTDYLRSAGCGYVLVVQSDAALADSYGALFSDGLAACEGNGSALYRIVWADGGLQLALMGEVGA